MPLVKSELVKQKGGTGRMKRPAQVWPGDEAPRSTLISHRNNDNRTRVVLVPVWSGAPGSATSAPAPAYAGDPTLEPALCPCDCPGLDLCLTCLMHEDGPDLCPTCLMQDDSGEGGSAAGSSAADSSAADGSAARRSRRPRQGPGFYRDLAAGVKKEEQD